MQCNNLEEELKQNEVYQSDFLVNLNAKYSKRTKIMNENIKNLTREKDLIHKEVHRRVNGYRKLVMPEIPDFNYKF